MGPDLVPRAACRTNRGFLHVRSASFVHGELPPPIPNWTASPAVPILPPPQGPVDRIFMLGGDWKTSHEGFVSHSSLRERRGLCAGYPPRTSVAPGVAVGTLATWQQIGTAKETGTGGA